MRCFLMALLFYTIIVNSPSRILAKQDNSEKKILQTYVNLTIITSEINKLSTKLDNITRQYGATIINFNINENAKSGNATLQVPKDKAASITTELKQLGTIENQSLSTSDYTQSYQETYMRLRFYETLKRIDIDKLLADSNISKQEISFFKPEFESMISNQIKSLESSLSSYENYGKYVQISLYFKKAENIDNNIIVEKVEDAYKKPKKSWNYSSNFILLHILFIANLIFLFSIYNLIRKKQDK